MIYQLMAIAALSLTLSMVVYTHMIRIQIQAQLGRTIAYCEASRAIIEKMSDILVSQEGAINALHVRIVELETKKVEKSGDSSVSMKDLMANITEGALADGDLDE